MRTTITYDKVTAEISTFGVAPATVEHHAMLHVTCLADTFRGQLQALLDACGKMRDDMPGNAVVLMRRFFISDAANQTDDIVMMTGGDPCATSIIQQPPLDGTKVAMWVYMVDGAHVENADGQHCTASHGAYRHIWSTQQHAEGDNAEAQTHHLMSQYAAYLDNRGVSLAANCMRTWLYVNDIDNNYSGMVRGRNNVFAHNGLTGDTHFIASTGIAGRQKHHDIMVQMDAYAVDGLCDGQVTYINAADHMNSTTEYGVSFERATAIDYGDRRHVLVSGTASIDNKGNTMHIGDVDRQTARMIENVCALLSEAHCTTDDLTMMTVYLRDCGDYHKVDGILKERFPDTPRVIVLAPVCRPGWLIEMECIAVRDCHDNRYADF